MEPIEVLVRESDRFAEESRNSLRLPASLGGATVAVNGLALQASPLALLLTTLAFGGVIVYLNQIFTDVLMIGGYRRHVEEEINAHFERNLLSWERKVTPLRRRNHSPRIIGIVAIGLWLGLGIVAQLQTWAEIPFYLSVGHIIVFALLIAALTTSMQEHNRRELPPTKSHDAMRH